MFRQRFRLFPLLAVFLTILFALVVVSTARSATPAPSVPVKHNLMITRISPSADSIKAGTKVTITGTGFANGAKVYFNDTAATDVTVVSATVITASVPQNVATTPVDVTVMVGPEAAALSHGANAVVRGYRNDKPAVAPGGRTSAPETTSEGTSAPVAPKPSSR